MIYPVDALITTKYLLFATEAQRFFNLIMFWSDSITVTTMFYV